MSVNRHHPHLLVLPEDSANRQVLNGFALYPDLNPRNWQILNEGGGWLRALQHFKDKYVKYLERYDEGRFLLVIDFDGQQDRREVAKEYIPPNLKDRVFILGSATEPEALCRALNGISKENLGTRLAEECHAGQGGNWAHAYLSHNAAELERLCLSVRGFLFR